MTMRISSKLPVIWIAASVTLSGLLWLTAPAVAAQPIWKISSMTAPTDLPPGDDSGKDSVVLTVTNFGSAAASGAASPIVVSDELAPGLSATAVHGYVRGDALGFARMKCVEFPVPSCSYEGSVAPYAAMQMVINVDVAAGAISADDHANVAGGTAATASLTSPVVISTTTPGFGIAEYDQVATNEDGSPDTQAGSHPYQFTTTTILNQRIGWGPAAIVNLFNNGEPVLQDVPVALSKDLDFNLPAGVVGNPSVLPQ